MAFSISIPLQRIDKTICAVFFKKINIVFYYACAVDSAAGAAAVSAAAGCFNIKLKLRRN